MTEATSDGLRQRLKNHDIHESSVVRSLVQVINNGIVGSLLLLALCKRAARSQRRDASQDVESEPAF